MQESATPRHPAWWSEHHESLWQRVREALRRDWEQTKADLTKKRGHDLHQSIGDTARQALGMEPLPILTHDPTPHEIEDHWYRVEHAVRYGYAAYVHHDGYDDWDEDLERKLAQEWEEMLTSHAWDLIKPEVQLGWHHAKQRGREKND